MRNRPVLEASVEEIIDALRDAPAAPHTLCAICYLKDRAAERAIKALYTELVNDYDLRLRWRNTEGFCQRHSELAAQLGDPLGTAILYLDVVERSLKCDGESTRLRRWPAPRRKRDLGSQCLCCIDEQDAEARYLKAAAESIRLSGSFVDALIQSRYGLCSRHCDMLRTIVPEPQSTVLQEEKRRRVELLRDQLMEIVRKSDYRYQHEPRGAEKDAWLRALQMFSSQ